MTTTLNFATAKITFLLLLAMPGISQAALMRPASPEGKKLVERIAEEASLAFVEQTEALTSSDVDSEKFRASCENAKSAILAQLESLDIQESSTLASAKHSLETVTCPESDAMEFAPASGQKLAHDKFFSVTLALRSPEVLY